MARRRGRKGGKGRKRGAGTMMSGPIHTQMNTPFMAGKMKRGRRRGKRR